MWLSLVERYVRDVEVAGSNPVTPIFPWKYGLFWKSVFFCCHFFTEDLGVGKIFWLEKRECAKDWKRGRSNKVPTKFKIMYARGFLKGVWGRSGENTVWNIWTWFKGNIEDYRGVQQLGEDWGLYVSEKEPVSNVSNVSTFVDIKKCLYWNGYRHFYFLKCTFNSALKRKGDKWNMFQEVFQK